MIHSLPHKEILLSKKIRETNTKKIILEKSNDLKNLYKEKDSTESNKDSIDSLSTQDFVLLITFILLSEEPDIDPMILAIVLFLLFDD